MADGRWDVVAVVIGVALVMAGPAGAAQVVESPHERTLVVRTYTQPDFRHEIATARDTAEAILRLAGVPVVWVECGLAVAGEGASSACGKPLRANELAVRVLSAGDADARPGTETLGVAFVDVSTGGGSLATVFGDRVRAMARTACVSVGDLLGRTLAHEIGHLLLGTNQHAPHGLMRASWSAADMRRNRAFQWLFGGTEIEMMRRGLTGRFRSANDTALP